MTLRKTERRRSLALGEANHQSVRRAISLFAIFLLFSVGHAQVEDVSQLLARGLELYHQGDFTSAITVLTSAKDVLSAQRPLPIDDLVNTFILLGVAYVGSNDLRSASGMFQSALLQKPDVALSTAEYSPRVISIFEQARNEVAGSLTVRSEPAGAVVFLDGRRAGETPCHFPALVAGPYGLFLQHPGYRGENFSVHVKPGAETTIDRKLEKAAGSESTLSHYPIKSAIRGQPLVINAQLERPQSDLPVKLYYRSPSAGSYLEKEMVRISWSAYRAVVSAQETTGDRIDYYVAMETAPGNWMSSGSAENPFSVSLEGGDMTPPSINHAPVPVCLASYEWIIYAEISEPWGILLAEAIFSDSGSQERHIPLSQQADGIWTAAVSASTLPSGEYSYKLRAVDACGNEALTQNNPLTVAVHSTPDLASILNPQARTGSDGAVELLWFGPESAHVDRATSFSGPYEHIGIGTGHRFTDKPTRKNPFKAGAVYYYRLSTDQTSVASQTVLIQPSVGCLPPSQILGKIKDNVSIQLSWEEVKEKGVSGYEIQFAPNWGNDIVTRARIPKRKTTVYIDVPASGLPAATTFVYRIATVGPDDTPCRWSGWIFVDIPPRPTSPENFRIAHREGTRLTLAWQPVPDPVVVSYELRRGTSADGPFALVTRLAGAESAAFTDLGDQGQPLEATVEYFYQLYAVDAYGFQSEPAIVGNAP